MTSWLVCSKKSMMAEVFLINTLMGQLEKIKKGQLTNNWNMNSHSTFFLRMICWFLDDFSFEKIFERQELLNTSLIRPFSFLLEASSLVFWNEKIISMTMMFHPKNAIINFFLA